MCVLDFNPDLVIIGGISQRGDTICKRTAGKKASQKFVLNKRT